MFKSMLALTSALVALPGQPPVPGRSDLRMKEESMIVEYTASANEAVIKVKAESETSLDRIEMLAPDGTRVLSVEAPLGKALSITGFTFDLLEGDPVTVLNTYAEGTYELRGRTLLGRGVAGQASLSHELPPAPVITYPRSGALRVPANGLVVTWQPDAAASGYQVMLEQNDNDGLSVLLPAGSSSFRVPDGVLRRRTRTMLEIGAIGANGNCTLVEVLFHVD